MKKVIMTAALSMALAAPAFADDVKIGVILGYTGPIESLTPDMAAGAELAMKEVNDSGNFMNSMTVVPVRGDSTCIDAQAASATAERLITAEGISAIVGADCSGVTTAILQNVAMANGIVMISPSATSPALTTVEDNMAPHLELEPCATRVLAEPNVVLVAQTSARKDGTGRW